MSSRRIVSWLACLALLPSVTGTVDAQSRKPKVPAGGDPGGVTIAYIDEGIDYTIPQIAARLARDGEGEIIGWDFIDNDRRPWRKHEDDEHLAFVIWTLLQPPLPARRLILIRASAAQPQSIVEAVKFVARTPARIVMLPSENRPPLSLLREAAARFPDLLFVVPALLAETEPTLPVHLRPNIILVRPNREGAADGEICDVAVPVPDRLIESGKRLAIDPKYDNGLVSGVAALAASLIASAPSLDVPTLKQHIVALATEPVPSARCKLIPRL